MAAELQIFDDASGIQSREVFVTNVTGDAIVAAFLIDGAARSGGLARADTYTVELEHDGDLWQGTVTPATGMPYAIEPFSGAHIAGGTMIDGVALEIGELSPAVSYRSVVEVGWHAGTLVAGATATGYPLWARNVGDAAGTDARVLIRPDATVRNLMPDAVSAIGVVEDSLELTSLIGVWGLTYTGDGFEHSFDVTFNGDPIGSLPGTEEGTQVHVALVDGPLVVYDLLSISESDVEVEVSAGFQDFQLAPDLAGAPGTWAGPELLLGALDIDESVPFWIRAQAAPGRTAAGNPYTAQLQARIVSV